MLTLRNIIRNFDGEPVLRGIDLDVVQGEIICLLGPSGGGKTTLLRIIAGLEPPDGGDVLLDGHSILSLPVHRRDFGLMFQDFALFPHLNVAANVSFGLRMHGVGGNDQKRKIRAMLELVGLAGFERRDVVQLSGGERQRVALARSLAPNPRLLMLDEPMGSLDAALRDRLVIDLRDIIKRIGQTAIYVTHDQAEAYAVADRIAVMNAGRIEQVGAPQAIYQRPATTFVARFLGLGNIVSVEQFANGRAQTKLGEFALADPADALLLHPDGLSLADAALPDGLPVVVVEATFRGSNYRLLVEHESGQRLVLSAPVQTSPEFSVGAALALRVNPSAVVPLAVTD